MKTKTENKKSANAAKIVPVINERETFKQKADFKTAKELNKIKAITVNETIIETDGSRNYSAWKETNKNINVEKAVFVADESNDTTYTAEIDFTLWAFLYHFWNRLATKRPSNMIYSEKNDLRMYRYFLTRTTASKKAQEYFKAENLKGINSLPYEESGKYYLQFQA